MAKKKLIKIDAGNLFQNSQQKTMSTSTSVGFRFLNGKNIKLCPEYDKTADGILTVNYFNDFVIPEYIPINGEYYRVTEIGTDSFPKTMESIFIPASINKIENGAFSFWPYSVLSKIQVSKDNKYYDSRESCNAVIETATNTLIVACANTIIPDSVERISERAFCAVALKSLFIGPNIVHIDFNFAKFFDLEEIKVSDDNKYYDSRENCNAIIETATNTILKGCKNTMIPNSVNRLGIASFDTVEGLEAIAIPDNIDVIDEYAFCNCSSLKEINIPPSIKNIGSCAFYNTSLTSISLKKRNIKVHKDAFESKVFINGQPRDYWLRPKSRYLDLQKQ